MESDRTLRILLLEDNLDDAQLIRLELNKLGIPFRMEHVDAKDPFLMALEQFRPDIILTDNALPDYDGFSAFDVAKKKLPNVPVIFVSGTIGEERAVEILKQGVSDYVLKDRLLRLAPAVDRALRESEAGIRKRALEEEIVRQNAILDGINRILLGAFRCKTDEEVARGFLTVASELTGSEIGSVIEIDEKGKSNCTASSEKGWGLCERLCGDLDATSGEGGLTAVLKEVMAEGKSRIAQDLSPESHKTGLPQVTNLMAAPLVDANDIWPHWNQVG